jgi:neutral ceramidase
MSRAHRLACALLLLLLPGLAGCAGSLTPSPASPPLRPIDDVLHAGVARADITPPPGLSLFGHGPEGRVAVGTLLRLYCEAFVIVKGAEAVALVPCDLGAMSIELHRAVADRVTRAHVPLGADRIVMMATHTHAGPAHYFGARQFGGAFSTRAPGFDPAVVDFLAERIAAAVGVAYASRVPARVRWRFDSAGALGLVHNRSFPAFVANRALPPCLTSRLCPTCKGPFLDYLAALDCPRVAAGSDYQEGPGAPPVASYEPDDLAADLSLSLLRIDTLGGDGGPRPLGAFVVFGVHNTGIPNTNDLYHSDVFGFALREAERLINSPPAPVKPPPAPVPAPAPAQEPPVGTAVQPVEVLPAQRALVGIANGIEGDVSPSVGYRSVAETRRLGTELGRRIQKAFDEAGAVKSAQGDDALERAYRELYIPDQLAEDQSEFYRKNEPPPAIGLSWDDDAAPNTVRLCHDPELGAPAAGGADDGPTWLRIFPKMHEGEVAADASKCQGLKLPVIGPSGFFGDDGLDFPAVGPIHMIRIGRGLVATAPFEMSTVVGTRIRDRLRLFLAKAKRHPALDGVAMVGLADGYLEYVTTPEEYAQQHYEGASTLYGPDTARFLGNHLLCLADWLYGDHDDAACRLRQPNDIDTVHPVRFDPEVLPRMPSDIGEPEEFVQLTDLDPQRTDTDLWTSWTVRFRGVRPGDALLREHLAVRIVDDAGRVVDDDRGTSLEIRYDVTAPDQHVWLARWTPRGIYCKKSVHFVIQTTTQLISKPFVVTCKENPIERRDIEDPHAGENYLQPRPDPSQAPPRSAP